MLFQRQDWRQGSFLEARHRGIDGPAVAFGPAAARGAQAVQRLLGYANHIIGR